MSSRMDLSQQRAARYPAALQRQRIALVHAYDRGACLQARVLPMLRYAR
eukprot:SAG31_NODE_35030_length_327_cov_0.583333_1_plen_48_part_10